MKTKFLPIFVAVFSVFTFISCDDANNTAKNIISDDVTTTATTAENVVVSTDDDVDLRTNSLSEVPNEIKNYVETNFPSSKIVAYEMDNDLTSKSHEVVLDNSTQIEFDKAYRIKEVKGNSELPNGILSSEISSYINKNYPEQHAISWELDDNKQQVDLNNGLELEFDKNGSFLRIDR